MNRLTTHLLLLAVLVLLGLVAWFEPGREPPAAPTRLLAVDPAAITAVHIEPADADAIVLERAGEQWWLRAPVVTRASGHRIEELLRRLTEARSLGTFAAPPDERERYGLTTPALRLTVDGHTIAFGGSTPIDSRRYVLVDGTLHTISDRLYYRLTGGFATFVSDRLLPDGAKIAALELPGLTLRSDQGRWQPEPAPESGSADAVAALVEGWRAARALEVLPGGRSSSEQVHVTFTGSETPVAFHIIKRTPELMLARPDLGITYRLPPSAADDLLTLPSANP